MNTAERRHHLHVPHPHIDYAIVSTSRGYVMRGSAGEELLVRDMYTHESFVVHSATGVGGAQVGAIITLGFTERDAPFFTDERSNPIELDSLVGKVTLRCATPQDK